MLGTAQAHSQHRPAAVGVELFAGADAGEHPGVGLGIEEEIPQRFAGDRQVDGRFDDIGNQLLALLARPFRKLGSADYA
ncbi:hypothetical protein [Nocardia thraciensis]